MRLGRSRRLRCSGGEISEIISRLWAIPRGCEAENFASQLLSAEILCRSERTGEPRAHVPHLVASRLPRRYNFPALIQCFQAVGRHFNGDSVLRPGSLAPPATETLRFKRWTISRLRSGLGLASRRLRARRSRAARYARLRAGQRPAQTNADPPSSSHPPIPALFRGISRLCSQEKFRPRLPAAPNSAPAIRIAAR
jgi:hypothetical protein